ncbi:hypothetical protein MOUN0_M08636 [Monosporozyma unispora]
MCFIVKAKRNTKLNQSQKHTATDLMHLHSELTSKKAVNTCSGNYAYPENFNISQTLYNGLTQEEIINLERLQAEDSILPQLSFSSSKRYRFRNRIKQRLQKSQKKNGGSSYKDSNALLSFKNRDNNNSKNFSKFKEEPLLCYNQFKTSQPSLLFDLTMASNRNNRSISFKPRSSVNRESSVCNIHHSKNFTAMDDGSSLGVNLPLSSSTIKRHTEHDYPFSFRNKRLRLDSDDQCGKFIISPHYLLSTNEGEDNQTYGIQQYQLPASCEHSDTSSSSNSSKLYSIPTFREARNELSISKLLGGMDLGSLNITTKGEVKLTYQNVSFYNNLTSEEVNDIPSQKSESFCSSSSLLPDTVADSDCNIPEVSKIKFSDKSSLFLYGKLKKPLKYTSQKTGCKPILKSTLNTKKDIEYETAKRCDSVGVNQFLQSLYNYENQRPYGAEQCEIIRNKQIMRYYKEEMQNLINEHCDVTANFPPPLPPGCLIQDDKVNIRRLKGVVQQDARTKDIILP